MSIQTYKLNLIPGGVPVRVPASQYDDSYREIRFHLYMGNSIYREPDGVHVTIDGTKPDGKGFSYPTVYGTDIDGTIYRGVTLTKQMTAVAGDVVCQLSIRGNHSDILMGSANFILAVERGALNEHTDLSETELPIFEQNLKEAVENAQNAQRAAETARDNAADYCSDALGAKTAAEAARGEATAAQTATETARNEAVAAAKVSQQALDTIGSLEGSLEAAEEAAEALTSAAVAASAPIPITIPAGWMRGDVNHDGIVNKADNTAITSGTGSAGYPYYAQNIYTLFPDGDIPLDYQAADADDNGLINPSDSNVILDPAALAAGVSKKSIDLMGNWTFDSAALSYSVEIPVAGVTTSSGALVTLYTGAETNNCGSITGTCLDGKLRITVNRPPTAEVSAEVRVSSGGTGDVTVRRIATTSHDTKTYSAVVGTTRNGWTAADCDYLCDGTDDQEDINAAIAAAGVGGHVHLLPGNYEISACINIQLLNVTLSGSGPGTELRFTDNNDSTGIDTYSGSVIKDMTLVDQSWITTQRMNLIDLRARSLVQNVYLEGNCGLETPPEGEGYGTCGIYCSGSQCRIDNAHFYECAVDMDLGARNHVSGNYHRPRSSLPGVVYVSGSNSFVSDNYFADVTITDGGTNNQIRNNFTGTPDDTWTMASTGGTTGTISASQYKSCSEVMFVAYMSGATLCVKILPKQIVEDAAGATEDGSMIVLDGTDLATSSGLAVRLWKDTSGDVSAMLILISGGTMEMLSGVTMSVYVR